MMIIEEGGRQLTMSKKMEKAVQDMLKVMMETWPLYGPNFDTLTFDGKAGYEWNARGAIVL